MPRKRRNKLPDLLWEFGYAEYYEMFDEIRHIKIDSKQIRVDYGAHAAFELNTRCPVVVRKGGRPLDCLADELGFDSPDALYYFVMGYRPKYKELRKLEYELEEWVNS